LQHARTIYPGHDPESVLLARLSPSLLGYDALRARELYRQLAERVAALPGVEAVSLARELSVGGGYSRTSLAVEGTLAESRMDVECSNVGPGYFRTLGITLLLGRDFTYRDREDTPPVLIVNQTMAQTFWPGASALGKRVSLHEGEWSEVIGVVENGRHRIAGEAQPPYVYFPFLQSGSHNVDTTLVWRHRGDAGSGLRAVRSVLDDLDSDLALQSPMTLLGAVRQATLPWRLAGMLATAFGVVGLSLAVLGVYGLVSYTFSQRAQEIGVRMALGAKPRDVFKLVMGQGLRLALSGVGVGVALALVSTRALADLLFGISTGDRATYFGVALLLVLVALVACWLPARRAARVEPMAELRRG
jgi:predicted permease